MAVAISTILQKPLLNATASDIAKVCRAGIKKAGVEVLEKDTFSSGKALMKNAKPIFNKKGKLNSFGKTTLSKFMEKLNLPQNSKVSEVVDALAKKGTNLWEI